MCQASIFEYKCSSAGCKAPQRTDAEIQVLRHCELYARRRLLQRDPEGATTTSEHDHQTQHIASKIVRNKPCRRCQAASSPAEKYTWLGLLLLTIISTCSCGRSLSNTFNCVWCIAMLHILLVTFPTTAFFRGGAQNLEAVEQKSVRIWPTAGESCAEYCNQLRTAPRSTHVAVDIANKAATEEAVVPLGEARVAWVAASIYMASQLVSQPEEAQRVMDVVGVGCADFWKAYWDLLGRSDEIVTGELVCHGADVSKLPRASLSP